MFVVDEEAEIVGDDDRAYRGTLVAWTADALGELVAYNQEHGLRDHSTAENDPWSGWFIIHGAQFPGVIVSVRTRLSPDPLMVISQGSSMDTARVEVPAGAFGTVAFGEVPFGGGMVMRDVPRWLTEITGLESFPPMEAASTASSEAAQIVSATTPTRMRERALNLVEELAGSLAGSADEDERRAGELALVAVAGLRALLGHDDIGERRRKAWSDVLTASAELAHVDKAVRFVGALRALAASYGFRIRVGG